MKLTRVAQPAGGEPPLQKLQEYPTLPYKIGFVLDDLAQSEADISVLSTFKVARAELWYLVG